MTPLSGLDVVDTSIVAPPPLPVESLPQEKIPSAQFKVSPGSEHSLDGIDENAEPRNSEAEAYPPISKFWETDALPSTSNLPATDAELSKTQKPVIVWLADLDAGPLIQSRRTYEVEASLDTVK